MMYVKAHLGLREEDRLPLDSLLGVKTIRFPLWDAILLEVLSALVNETHFVKRLTLRVTVNA